MSFNLLHIWAQMGTLSRIVAVCLLLMATASIAVVVERMFLLLRSAKATNKFLGAAGPALEGRRWTQLLAVADEHKRAPLARLVGPTLRKLEKGDDGKLGVAELARREAERQKEVLSADLRRGLSVLASVGSVAPFVGLLGTVVGIISAFQGIAATGSGGLGAVSAGISEALVETALGLCVAIPAVLAFNGLSTRIATVEAEVAQRTGELLDEVEDDTHGSIDSIVAPRAA